MIENCVDTWYWVCISVMMLGCVLTSFGLWPEPRKRWLLWYEAVFLSIRINASYGALTWTEATNVWVCNMQGASTCTLFCTCTCWMLWLHDPNWWVGWWKDEVLLLSHMLLTTQWLHSQPLIVCSFAVRYFRHTIFNNCQGCMGADTAIPILSVTTLNMLGMGAECDVLLLYSCLHTHQHSASTSSWRCAVPPTYYSIVLVG